MNVRQIVKMAVPVTADSTDDLLTSDVVGRKTDTAIQSASNTASLVRYAKGGVTALGDPTAHTLSSLAEKWGDIARTLDLILGARWDGAGDLGTDIAAILTAVGVGAGVIGQLTYYGVVTAIGANQFTIPGLAGLGAFKFADPQTPHRAFVLRTIGGTAAAPQGEQQPITAYVTATGLFTTAAFSAAVSIGDEIMILHPRLAEILDITTSLGAVGDTATADDMSDIATTSAQAKLRRLLLRLSSNAFTATIQGAARTELDTMLAQIATYLSAAGAAYSATVNPGGVAKTDIEETLEDLGDMLAGAGIATYPAAAVPGDGVSLAEVARQIYNDVVAIAAANVLHEQADVAISDVAPIAPLVFNVLNLAAANTRYVVRGLRIKTVDPAANTITVRLYKLVNNALTEVANFVITTANYGTYHNLMDMFGLPQLVGDQLKVTIEASAVGYAVLAQYEYSTATV